MISLTPSQSLPRSTRVGIFGLALAYFATGKLALLLAIPPGYATAVWPASGVALAGVLLFGHRVWPGILLGSFLVNIATSLDSSGALALARSLALPAVIGLGAALQGVVGAFLIRRFSAFPLSIEKVPDVFRILGLGGPVACLIGALTGATSLTLTGAIQWSQWPVNWFTWWLGDTIGVLIVLPLLLVWTSHFPVRKRGAQLSVIVPVAVAVTLVVIQFLGVRAGERQRARLQFERRVDHLSQSLIADKEIFANILYSIQRHRGIRRQAL